MKTLTAILATLLIVPLLRGQTDTVKPIEPPFGLSWGETSTNIETWAKTNKFPMTQGTTKTGRTAIEIEGPFPSAEFDRLRFYFQENQLNEVELQFNEIGAGENKAQEFTTITKALAIKDQIDKQLGKGQLIKNEKGTKDGTNWQFIQQIWTDEEHAIWLAIFNASQPKQGNLSMASLHYRWETKICPKKVDKQKGK